MSKLDDFVKCVTETVNGKVVSVKCNLGLWEVSSTDTQQVYLEAFHYWKQYNEDGEYHQIIGGDNPVNKLINHLTGNREGMK